MLVGDSSAHARRRRTKHRARQHKASQVPHEASTAPTVLSAQAIDTVSKSLMLPSCYSLLGSHLSAFGPIPIFTGVFAHSLEFLNVVPTGVAIVLGPVIAPTSVLIEFVADIIRRGVGIIYTFIGIFATIGVVSAGLGKGKEEKEDEGGLHLGGLRAR